MIYRADSSGYRTNSPLISYSMNDTDEETVFDDGAYVEMVFRHQVEARQPGFQIVHRAPRDGEQSAVIMSASCSFINEAQ